MRRRSADSPATAPTSDPLPLPSGAPRLPYSDEDEPDSSGTTHVRTKLDPRAAYALDPKTMITMQRTGWSGACPVYTVGLTGDGRVHFYGDESPTTRGYASSRVIRWARSSSGSRSTRWVTGGPRPGAS